MFRHKGCGGTIFGMQQIKISSGFTLTPAGVVSAGVGKISRVTNSSSEIKWSCCQCDNEVKSTDLVANCMQCGNEFPANELYVLHSCSGIYCRNCCDEFYPGNERIIASTAMNKKAR